MFGPPTGLDTTNRILPGAWDNFARDIEAHPPDFIVDDEVLPDRRYPITRFPVLTQLLDEQYRAILVTPDTVIYERLPSGARLNAGL
jgi:hypothetical protein